MVFNKMSSLNYEVVCLNNDFETINTKIESWKEINISNKLTIPDNSLNIKKINSISIGCAIQQKKIVETPCSMLENKPILNAEGKIITGFKIIVKGEVDEKIFYTTDNKEEFIRSCEFRIPFYEAITLDKTSRITDTYYVKPYIEDLNVNLINPRQISNNVIVFLNAERIILGNRVKQNIAP